MKRLLIALLTCMLLLPACSRIGQPYDYYNMSFTYPRSWRPMAEVSESYQSGREFMWMGLLEDLTVTSTRQPDEVGAFFSVASLEQTDGPIDADIDFIYALNEADIRNYGERPITVAGIVGLSVTYERKWQNTWYQFHDVWIQHGPLVYLLSFRAPDLESYRAEMEMILDSFKFD